AYLHEDGYVSRGTQMLGAQRDIIGRVQLRGDLAPNFKATLGFLYNDSKQNATPWVFDEFDMKRGIEGVLQGNYGDWLNDSFKLAGQAPLAAYNDPRLVKGPYQAPDVCLIEDFNPDYDDACNQYIKDKYWQADLTLDWKINDQVSLRSISGFSKLKHRAVTDLELIGMEMRYEVLNSEVFYQELQLNAALFGGAVDLVTGGSYFHENSSAPYNYVLDRRGTSNYPATPGLPGTIPNSDGGLYTRLVSDVFQTSSSWGLFASGTWHIVDGLNLTGGLRQAWDHKDYSQTRYATVATPTQGADFTAAPGMTSTTVHNSAPFHALDYRATLDYHFTKDIMGYATISKAYKAGSFSYTVASSIPGPSQSPLVVPIPNEKVVNYEAGLRMTFFDRRLRLNPTGFVMHYTNRQSAVRVNCGTGVLANVTPGSPACPVGFLPLLQNQGDAWIRGIELDGQLSVGGGLTLDGSFGLTTYTLHNAPAPTTHLFPDIPKTSYNLGATYVVNAGFGRATLNVNYAYVGKQSVYPDDTADSGYILPSYGLVNARLQIKPKAIPLTISLYANNLLDKVYASYAQRFGGGFWDSGAGTGVAADDRSALSVVRGRPREFGVSAKY
ncbi:MAG: TonB-dependent receptor, partial [Sphingomonas bacterium]